MKYDNLQTLNLAQGLRAEKASLNNKHTQVRVHNTLTQRPRPQGRLVLSTPRGGGLRHKDGLSDLPQASQRVSG